MRGKGPVLVLGALDGEISAFLENLQILGKQQWKDFTFYHGKLAEKEIVLAKSGVGKVLSAIVTQKMIDLFMPSAIIFTGTAGSLHSKIHLGDILIGEDSIQHDVDASMFNKKRGEIPYTPYRFFNSDAHLLQAALSYNDSKHKVYKGRVLTGDQFISYKNIEGKSYLTEELQGDCVEMEGASVALVAAVNEIPYLVIRTISDKAYKKMKINFREVVREASENSLGIVKHILNKI